MVQHTCKIISLKWKQPYVPGSEGVQEPVRACHSSPPSQGAGLIESLVILMLPHTQDSAWGGRKESLVSMVKEVWTQFLAFIFGSQEGLVVPGRISERWCPLFRKLESLPMGSASSQALGCPGVEQGHRLAPCVPPPGMFQCRESPLLQPIFSSSEAAFLDLPLILRTCFSFCDGRYVEMIPSLEL